MRKSVAVCRSHRTGLSKTVLLLALGGLALSGCATRWHSLPYDGALLQKPDPRLPEESGYDVPLGPLDVVHVEVFRVEELSGDYQVDSHGMIDMPLLGPLNVRDMNPAAFAAELRERYGKRYLNNPNIAVRIVTSNGANITVEGGVNQSGIYPLTSRTTLLGAVALAHGLNQDAANARRAAIFRKQGGKTVAAAFDLVAIHKGKMVDPVVYPGDTVVVDSNELRKLYKDLVNTLPAIAIFNTL